MLRSFFGIDDGDPDRIARERIAGRALLVEPELAGELPLLFEFLGVPDPESSPPAAQRRGPPAAAHRPRLRDRQRAAAAPDPGAGGRGPALDRPRQRGDDGDPAGDDRDHQHAARRQLPARVRAALGERRDLRPPAAGAAGARRHRRAAAPHRRRRSLARRPRGADPRAHPGQPVLRRGAGPRAGRVRPPGGRARRLPAGPPDRRPRGTGHRAGRAGGADRPPRPRGQAAAAGPPRLSARRSAPRRCG